MIRDLDQPFEEPEIVEAPVSGIRKRDSLILPPTTVQAIDMAKYLHKFLEKYARD